MSEVVLVEQLGETMRLSINRPQVRNALNEEVCAGLRAGVELAERTAGVRVIVITGVGDQAFCAGGDMKAGAGGAPFSLNAADPRHYVIALFRVLEACTLPTIARVNGHALAGGMGLVCACDMALSVKDASFGVPETRVGLFPMMILAYMMRIIPRRKLFEICMTGDTFKADEALALGIVNEVVAEDALDARLDALVSRITARSPTAIKLGKQAFRAIEDMPLDKAFEYTQLMLPIMSQTEDAVEGLAAFNEKRSPKWPGR